MTTTAATTTGVSPGPPTVLCDLDGVVWLARRPIEGAAAAVARLRADGWRVVFVTNNSADTVATQQEALAAIGVPADGCVVTSPMAAARLVAPDDRIHVCGGPGIVEAMTVRGAVVLGEDAPGGRDAVVVGIDREFDYRRLSVAAAFVRDGARLVATNDDATYPTPRRPIPGGGAMVAAVAAAGGAVPIVAGKPHRPMAEAVAELLGGLDPATTLVVGDRPSTDGAFARQIGCGFALVRSGVTAVDAAVELPDGVECVLDVADLAAVAGALADGPPRRSPRTRYSAAMANSTIERLIESGIQFTEMSRKQADELVSKLVQAGEVQRQEAERIAQLLIERGRDTSERVASLVRAEVDRQAARLNDRYDELEQRVEDLAARVARKKAPAKKKAAAKKAPAKKRAAAKKAPAKKRAAAKKAPAKKRAAAKKAPAKKRAAAKKAPAKKRAAAKKTAPVGSSGVRKVSTSRGS